MEKHYEEELRKERGGAKGTKLKTLKPIHIIILLILIFIVYWAWQYGADEARINKLSEEEREITYNLLNKMEILPVPPDYTTAKIIVQEQEVPYSAIAIQNLTKKISQPEETRLNKYAILIMAGLVIAFFAFLVWRGDTGAKYISLDYAIAIVCEALEKRGYKRRYEIQMPATTREWKSLQEAESVLDKTYVYFDLFPTKGGTEHWVCFLDPRKRPEIEGHIRGWMQVREGWRGQRIKDTSVIEYGKPIKTGSTGELLY